MTPDAAATLAQVDVGLLIAVVVEAKSGDTANHPWTLIRVVFYRLSLWGLLLSTFLSVRLVVFNGYASSRTSWILFALTTLGCTTLMFDGTFFIIRSTRRPIWILMPTLVLLIAAALYWFFWRD